MEFNLSWLSDPTVFAVNRLPACSDHDIYRSVEEANNDASSLVRSLDGKWAAHFAMCPKDAPDVLLTSNAMDAELKEITVPGEFQLQYPQWDPPHYVNTQYPWDGREPLVPPQVSETYNPTVTAIRTFELTENDMDAGRIVLTFGGVEAAVALFINGQFVGYSEDSFTPHRFDVTAFVHMGENRMAARVFKRTSGSWLEDQDFWRFSGIHRSVTLTFEPKIHLADVFVHTPIEDNYTRALLDLELAIDRAEGQVHTVLTDKDGNEILSETCEAAPYLTFCKEAPGVKLWSAEEPNLYTLTITLTNPLGEVMEVARTEVGFREFKMIDKVMHVNGKRVVFHGVNRHEFDCDLGRVMTKEGMLKDVKIIKSLNINAIRTCHYPNHSFIYKLCDRYGLYVIDETNIETHGSWSPMHDWVLPGDKPEWQEAVLDRGASMLERDKNHACILFWSCGNESWSGSVLYELSNYFRRRDPSRLVHYENCCHVPQWHCTTDVYSRMYAKVADIEEYLNNNPDKPFINCEYTHAMGNSCGGIDLYRELEDKYPMYQGGFIWDYVDQGLRTTAPNGHMRMTYGGDWGDRPSDWQFIGNGIVFADRSLTPKAQEVRHVFADVKLIPDETGVTIHNRRMFTALKNMKLVWQIDYNMEKVAGGFLPVPAVPAGESQHIDLPYGTLPEGGLLVATCFLQVTEDALLDEGTLLYHGQTILRDEPICKEEAPCAPAPVLGDTNTGVHAEKLSVLFEKSASSLISFKDLAGQESLLRGPLVTLFRAFTDNDRGNGDSVRQGIWHAASRYNFVKCDDPVVEEGCTTLTYHYNAPVLPGTDITVTYKVKSTDTLEVTLNWPGVENQPDLPALGLTLQLDPRLCHVAYYGMGPSDNYNDRKEGAWLDNFTYEAKDGYAPYFRPQESGNHMGVRRMAITNDAGHGVLVEGKNLEISVQPYLPEELMAAAHQDELQGSSRTVVDIALFRKGVGGDDSWGAPVLPQFTYPSNKPYTLTFTLKAL